jgi:hypothetical protein
MSVITVEIDRHLLTGFNGVPGGDPEAVDDGRDLFSVQPPRHGVGCHRKAVLALPRRDGPVGAGDGHLPVRLEL